MEGTHEMSLAIDVASSILERAGPMPALRLHRLLYCAQAWFLAEHGRPLFEDPIEAWAAGPVVRVVHEACGGRLRVSRLDLHGSAERLRVAELAAVEAALAQVGALPDEALAALVQAERPWQEARRPRGAWGRPDPVIPRASLLARYASVARA